MTSITETRLRAMVASHYCVEDERIHADAEFETDLGGDSLDSVEFTMYVEEEFGIELGDDEADAATGEGGTFGKLLALVDEKIAAKREAA